MNTKESMVWITLESEKRARGRVAGTDVAARIITEAAAEQGIKVTKTLIRKVVGRYNKFNKDNKLNAAYIIEEIA